MLLLDLGHLLAELLLSMGDGLLLGVVDTFCLAIALHELVLQQG